MSTGTIRNRVGSVAGSAIWLLLGVSLGVNVWFLTPSGSSDGPIRSKRLTIGSVMRPLPARALSGEARSVEFAGTKPTILYYFSPNCHWCERNWNNVRTLAAQTKQRYRFVAVSTTDQVAAYLAERHLSFETVTGIPETVLREYGIGGTPRTIVISQQGKVLADWLGAYSPEAQLAVERFFGVSLPGLLPAPVVAAGS